MDTWTLVDRWLEKPNHPHLLAHALRLSRAGTVIVVDNIVRGGALIDGDDPSAIARVTADP